MHRGYLVYERATTQIAALQQDIPSFLSAAEARYVSKALASLQGLINTQIMEMDRLGYRHKRL